jgi:hypothetical protein
MTRLNAQYVVHRRTIQKRKTRRIGTDIGWDARCNPDNRRTLVGPGTLGCGRIPFGVQTVDGSVLGIDEGINRLIRGNCPARVVWLGSLRGGFEVGQGDSVPPPKVSPLIRAESVAERFLLQKSHIIDKRSDNRVGVVHGLVLFRNPIPSCYNMSTLPDNHRTAQRSTECRNWM